MESAGAGGRDGGEARDGEARGGVARDGVDVDFIGSKTSLDLETILILRF